MISVLGNATEVALAVLMNVSWPKGETGEVVMRSEKFLLSMFAMSKTPKPFLPSAA